MAVNVQDSATSVNSIQKTGSDTSDTTTYTLITSMESALGKQYLSYTAFTFDSVNSVNVDLQADVTSYPVETGSYISDHVQIRNSNFSIEGVITNTPIRKYSDLLYSSTSDTRVSLAINYLESIFNAREPIIFVTEHQALENVILKGISYSYKSEDAIIFQLSFEQIRLAEKKAVRVDITAKKTATNKATGGTKKVALPTSTLPDRLKAQNATTGTSSSTGL